MIVHNCSRLNETMRNYERIFGIHKSKWNDNLEQMFKIAWNIFKQRIRVRYWNRNKWNAQNIHNVIMLKRAANNERICEIHKNQWNDAPNWPWKITALSTCI